MSNNLPEERIFTLIYEIRGHKVMLDRDLAELYDVETRALKQAVRRNLDRFPDDFMFELTASEWNQLKESLRSQNVTLEDSQRGKHSKYPPFAFTEQGVAMLSSVLNSKQAISVNIHIMRVFVKVRSLTAGYSELLEKIQALQDSDSAQSEAIDQLYRIFKELIEPQQKDRKPIGYKKQGDVWVLLTSYNGTLLRW